ncbi:polysaccharide deacetylase family protein [Alteromonas pelagimontana]|uniref:Polysaccharide deacetylase family protein n=1 Tax=Alteromonas pelagimontana TaxID=1858656 RepID=A0A6M4MFZ0_9ALTE|nr:polysaccharide deacetylase family protein [Alteromonas pelagimontana]QJR81982.1 polysaccharide deacetylase family protein [Alteromonas pelagimontana]
MLKPLLKSCAQWVAGTIGWASMKRGDKKLIVLMYHRVLPTDDPRFQYEEPGMVVSDRTFAMHMQTLSAEKLPVMTVSKWVGLSDVERPALTVAITFDDGWLDNYEYAFPVLKQYGFPSTLYVVSDFLGLPAPFWPNKVLRLLLTPGLRIDENWQPLLNMINAELSLPLSRNAAAEVIAKLKQYDDDDIYQALASIKADTAASQIEMINQEQLLDAQTHYGVEVGCHTRKHYRLVEGLNAEKLQDEVVQSKQILEALTHKAVSSFCFPNGDFSDAAHALVKSNYCCAVTTKRGINTSGSLIPSKLNRVGVHDDISNRPISFKARLSCWL